MVNVAGAGAGHGAGVAVSVEAEKVEVEVAGCGAGDAISAVSAGAMRAEGWFMAGLALAIPCSTPPEKARRQRSPRFRPSWVFAASSRNSSRSREVARCKNSSKSMAVMVGTGSWGPLFTAVAGDGSEGSSVNSTVLAGGTKAGGADSFCESLLAR